MLFMFKSITLNFTTSTDALNSYNIPVSKINKKKSSDYYTNYMSSAFKVNDRVKMV